MDSNNPTLQVKLLAFAVIVVMLGLGLAAAVWLPNIKSPFSISLNSSNVEIKKFSSEEEFRAFIQESQQSTGLASFGSRSSLATPEMGMGSGPAANLQMDTAANLKADRVSGTNVQVAGIDEADIVKTNGKEIFYSNPNIYYLIDDVVENRVALPTIEDRAALEEKIAIDPIEGIVPPMEPKSQTKIISAFPPESMAVVSEAIDEGGNLLLDGSYLVVIGNTKITGFDVSNPSSPKKLWEKTVEDTYVETARLQNGEIVLVTRKYISPDSPCIQPLMGTTMLRCTDIYYPSVRISSDSVYTVLKTDPKTGDTKGQVSFTGSNGTSVVYVSPQSIYVTYTYSDDPVDLFTQFFSQEAALLPQEYRDRLAKLQGYDISDQAKLIEYEKILSDYRATLSQDGRLKFEEDMNNKLKDFAQGKVREVEKTGIVKINSSNLQIASTGVVPGSPLNQFSLDEYKGNLRIATTVGQNSWLFPADSVNDLYVLNEKLEVVGSVVDLAKDERIYSVRYINDLAYMVTFKQIDPFFVLDLANPNSPRVVGELKIPGFSSYLHPLTENLVLGVGQEEGNVKLSLFDVSNPANPQEINKYNMNEFWTEVQNNHHAFLQDEKHKIFFIPGGEGGYIFSYENNQIELVKTVAGVGIQRALFLNDYLYIIGNDEITVLNEIDWSTIKTIGL